MNRRPLAIGLLPLVLAVGCSAQTPSAGGPEGPPGPASGLRIRILLEDGEEGTKIVDVSVSRDIVPASAMGFGLIPEAVVESAEQALVTEAPMIPKISLLGADRNTLDSFPILGGSEVVGFEHRWFPDEKDPLGVRPSSHVTGFRVVSLPYSDAVHFVSLGESGQPLRIRQEVPGQCAPCVQQSILLHPHQPRDTDEVMDIVILGDGFQQGEQDAFFNRADELTRHLLATEPFATHSNKIQVWLIPTISEDSGVDDSTAGDLDTCLDLTGGENNCCGTESPEKMLKALACRFPPDEVDLRIVLANVKKYGGRGLHDIRTAYINLNGDSDWDRQVFHQMALHEIAHALAGLADEYMGCEPVVAQREWANVATEAQRQAGTVPWRDLADPEELLDGELLWVWRVLEDEKNVCPTTTKAIPADYDGKLGLYWGAMYVDGAEPVCAPCDVYNDPRGANYYRPMARCKMRDVMDDFCRVCARELERAILGSIGSPEPPAAPTGLQRTDVGG